MRAGGVCSLDDRPLPGNPHRLVALERISLGRSVMREEGDARGGRVLARR
jgi:hypothetical protein